MFSSSTSIHRSVLATLVALAVLAGLALVVRAAERGQDGSAVDLSPMAFVGGVVFNEAEGADRGFRAVDLVLDPRGRGLGAYQLTLALPKGVLLVGVEGGAHAAYSEPAYYDPEALHAGSDGGGADRVILAAFSLDEDLPRERTRIARLHLQVETDEAVVLAPMLTLAADADERGIDGAVLTIARSTIEALYDGDAR